MREGTGLHPEPSLTVGLPPPSQGRPRIMMIVIGPVIGVLTGVVAGLFAWVAAKLFNRKSEVA